MVGSNAGARGLNERMEIHDLSRHQRRVDDGRYLLPRVVYQSERCCAAGLDAQNLLHDVGRRKAEAAACADPRMERPEVDFESFPCHKQEKTSLLVLEQEILGEGPGAGRRVGRDPLRRCGAQDTGESLPRFPAL